MSKRPKRTVQIKSESPIQLPRKWKEEEMETLLNCIMTFGHKNLEQISNLLPGRSIDNIKTFMRTVHDTAGKVEKPNYNCDDWLKECDTYEGTPWRDCIQISQILKYLSVDGLLENHPLPERCQGIDFRQAYRLVYQAMMGYPIQPVNKETADFVAETLAELTGEINKQTDIIKRVELYLKENSTQKEQSAVVKEPENPQVDPSPVGKKPLKVYHRKRPMSVESSAKPSLKIFVEEIPGRSSSGLGSTKDFNVAVEGDYANAQTTVNVPVPYDNTISKDEMELLKSSSYNPFQIPEKWLREPLYISVLQALQ